MISTLQKIRNLSRVDYINILIIAYGFTLTFPAEIKRPIVILLILFWISDRKNYEIKLPNTNIFLFFILFITYSLLSYLWSDVTFAEALEYVRRYWYYLPIFILFKYLQRDWIKYAISAFLSGVFISEILSYGNYFGIWQIGLGHPKDPTVFIQHTIYSVFLAIASIFLFTHILQTKIKKYKIIYSIFFITMTVNLLVNSGRTGYIAFFITILILLIFNYKLNYKYIFTAFSTTAILLFSAYTFSPNFKHRIKSIEHDITKVIKESNYNTSIGARIGFWIIGTEIIAYHPIVGTGIAAHIDEKNKLIKEKGKNFKYVGKLRHYHNNYLEILAQYGLLGFLLFALTIIAIIRIPLKNKIISILKITTVTVFLLASLTDMVFFLKDSILFFSFLVGLSLAQFRIEQNE